jgi:ArsR family metal-binding transcriptional regulator
VFVKKYTDLSIQTPACHPGTPILSAHFRFDTDISELFPYINATVEDAKYFDIPLYIRFTLDGVMWALYPENAAAVPFENHSQAMEHIDRMIRFLNGLYTEKESITPNHKKHKPVPVIDIYKVLPGTNCKECGFSACMAFAAALSKEEMSYDKCPWLKTPEKEQLLTNIGVELP